MHILHSNYKFSKFVKSTTEEELLAAPSMLVKSITEEVVLSPSLKLVCFFLNSYLSVEPICSSNLGLDFNK